MVEYYNKFPKWGYAPDGANLERITVTQSFIPAEVNSILDLGCGDGAITNQFAEKGFNVFSADFSSAAIQFAKGKRVISNVNDVPFANQQFDAVVCAETIEHLPEGVYEKALSEIERITKQYIIISTPNQEYLPDSNIRCGKCGNLFHRNLHTRSLDRNTHKTLFQNFELIKTIGVRAWYQSPFVVNFQQKNLKTYTPGRNIICPSCGHINSDKPGVLKYLIFGLKHAILRFIPGAKRSRWIVSFYKRKN